jgi:Icc-related predicted phosphoesterase
MTQQIFVIGDTHGDWNRFFIRIYNTGIRDCTLLHVGDIGIGFKSKDEQIKDLAIVNSELQELNITFLGIRGNHDDPSYFKGNISFSNLELLQDYTIKNLSGKKFLFIGGAISVDRINRIENKSWWRDEKAVVNVERVTPCDVLITHAPPSWNYPSNKAMGWFDQDPTLWEECCKERQDIDKLIELSQCTKHFCGHFHVSSFVSLNKCDSTILDVYEIKEIRF